jgi:thiamine biosynthesis lipoprotein
MKGKKKTYAQVAFLLALIVGTVLIVKQQRDMPYQKDEGFIFGTVYHATYQYDKDLNNEIIAELNKVDGEFSMFNKLSTVTDFNNGKRIEASDMFMNVLTLSQDVNKDTEGAFDITVAPLVNAWGFGFKNQKLPNKQQVDSLRRFIGMQNINVEKLNGKTYLSKKLKNMMLDFSAVAKGYGSDAVATVMRRHDIKNYMIEIGGEVVTSGLSEKRLPWKIGVTKPSDDSLNTNQELQTVLDITDKAMATSGNYRNFYYKNGKKYAHTIDPKTGYPVQHSLLSSTVLANRCAEADAYATSFMVMGIEKAKVVLKRHPELMAYFIYSDKDGKTKVWSSPALENKIEK